MASNDYEFTSDEEINAFNHEDKSMDLTGYVDQIDGLRTLKTAQGHVLKFVLNNASQSRIRVLIWGTALASKYEPFIRLNQIVQINGGSLKNSNPQFRNPNEKVCLLEFHVQSYSVLIFHGEYKGNMINTPVVSFKKVEFEDVMLVDGPIEISGYIKSNGFCEVKTTNASYGQGVIASGKYRLTIQIASFATNSRLKKGVHVQLRGVMNKQAGGGLRIADMDSIDVLEDDVKDSTELKKSIHNVMMLTTKRSCKDMEDLSNATESKRMSFGANDEDHSCN